MKYLVRLPDNLIRALTYSMTNVEDRKNLFDIIINFDPLIIQQGIKSCGMIQILKSGHN